MKILFVHQNFPGQFPRLSRALKARGHQVLALTTESNARPSPVPVVKYKTPEKPAINQGMGRHYAEHIERGIKATLAARTLRDRHRFTPDVIVGHSGWGETLFLKEIWPDARLTVYSEMMFRASGLDVGFDPEFSPGDALGSAVSVHTRQAHLIQGFVGADQVICPTQFQADTHPAMLRPYIRVLHDGIDCDLIAPDPEARLTLPDGTELAAGDEVLTFVSRALEPYRGFHIFMRALPAIMAARPGARVVIVGRVGQSYGPAPKDAPSWKQRLLDELGDRLDLSRIHFTGALAYADYIRLLQVSRLHIYLTYPFVLSWSALEAMAAGCQIVASDTPPVREVMEDGKTARLVDFFDVEGLAQRVTEGLADPGASAGRRAAARDFVRANYPLQGCLDDWIGLIEGDPPAPDAAP